MPPFDPTFLILIVLMFGAMYFLMILPQKKHRQATAAMQASIAEGDRVMLTSGVFATVRHIGDKQMVVELAPATEVTVLRQAVMRKVLPEEEEFEFDDVLVADTSDGSDNLTEQEQETAAASTTEITEPEDSQDSTGEQSQAQEPDSESSNDSAIAPKKDEQGSATI